jgi:tetratricopeptide (TPR) repeat protein
MAIRFDCPWCTQSISVDESEARARIECPHCNRPIEVPNKPTHKPPPSLPESSLASSADAPASGFDSVVSEPLLPPAMGRRAILKAAIRERQAGKPAEEIYKTYQGQVRPNSALAMSIASVADPERKRRYAVLNYVLVALLVLLALSNLMAGSVLFGLCMLVFAFAIARFDGRVYPLLFLLLLISALNSLVRGELLDLVLLAAVIAVAFLAQRKIFPNVGPFGVKKSADGSYIWARRLAEATAASSSLPPATPPSPAPPAASLPHRRNWVWIVSAGCLTMLVCLALVVCAFVLLVISAVKSSSFYQIGVSRAKSDARVQAALGSNLHDGMFLPGDTRMNGSSREYEFRIPISGSKGKGTIYLVVAKSAGQYQIDNLSVKTNDGEIIDLNESNPSSVSNARDQSIASASPASPTTTPAPSFNFNQALLEAHLQFYKVHSNLLNMTRWMQLRRTASGYKRITPEDLRDFDAKARNVLASIDQVVAYLPVSDQEPWVGRRALVSACSEQTRLFEANWNEWHASGFKPKKGESKPWQKEAMRLQSDIDAMEKRDNEQSYNNLGAEKLKNGDVNGALRDFNQAIELDPQYANAYQNRAYAKVKKKQYAGGTEDIQKAIQLDPRNGDYYLSLGWFQLFNRKPRESIAASLKALELAPGNAVVINGNLAHAYLLDNQFDKAKAIYLENKDAKLHDGRAFTQSVLDDFKELQEAGITHPDMDKVKALFAGKDEQ